MPNQLQLSFSSISMFLNCKRMYWWKYVRNLVPNKFNKAYLIGTVVHHGIYQLYAKNPNAINIALELFNEKVNELRASLNISPEIEQDLVEQELVIKGMLNAYAARYSDIIEATLHHVNEHELTIPINDNVRVTANLDNILDSGDGKLVHEIKTSKSVTPDYVRNIQNSLQAAIYFHGYNLVNENDKLIGIMYDVIKKPSIRRKKLESYQGYLDRLVDYYDDPTKIDNFYMEIIKVPLLGKNRVFETIDKISSEILTYGDDKSMYYCNDMFCNIYGKCTYFDLCHYNENPNTLMNFKDREIDESSTNIVVMEE